MPDTIKMVVAGPGFGECIVVAFPDDFFLVVDCCRNAEREPYPSVILPRLGFNAGRSRLGVCITHWHSDHISGVSEFLEGFTPEFISLPIAFRQPTFVNFAKFHNEIRETGFVNATGEIVSVLNRIFGLNIPVRWVGIDRLLVQGSLNQYSIYALSPVDEAVGRFLKGISNLVPRKAIPPRSLPALTENECSSVILFTFGSSSIVLGADLEESTDIGWSKVISTSQALGRNVLIYKIPHHGSSNAHCDDFVNKYLRSDSISVVAPYSRGSNPPPNIKDIERISRYPGRKFITSTISINRVNAKREYGNDTDNFLRKFGITLYTANETPGEVQLNCENLMNTVEVKLFGDAREIVSD